MCTSLYAYDEELSLTLVWMVVESTVALGRADVPRPTHKLVPQSVEDVEFDLKTLQIFLQLFDLSHVTSRAPSGTPAVV